jgi:hypothetical protein
LKIIFRIFSFLFQKFCPFGKLRFREIF